MMSFFQLKDQIPLAVPGTVIEAAKTVASLKKLEVEAVLDANITSLRVFAPLNPIFFLLLWLQICHLSNIVETSRSGE